MPVVKIGDGKARDWNWKVERAFIHSPTHDGRDALLGIFHQYSLVPFLLQCAQSMVGVAIHRVLRVAFGRNRVAELRSVDFVS